MGGGAVAGRQAAAGARIPRRIHAFWGGGEAAAPPAVAACLARWRALNPGWSLAVLDWPDARAALSDFPLVDVLRVQAVTDVLRIELLARAGGVWIDATVLPRVPLERFLDPRATFAAFERPAPPRAIASWFLAAAEGSPLVARWRSAVRAYWDRPRALDPGGDPADPLAAVAPGAGASGTAYPYFWLHYLFGRLVATDAVAATAWREAQRLPADAAHALQHLLAAEPDAAAEAIRAAAGRAPLQKLDWRRSATDRAVALLVAGEGATSQSNSARMPTDSAGT